MSGNWFEILIKMMSNARGTMNGGRHLWINIDALKYAMWTAVAGTFVSLPWVPHLSVLLKFIIEKLINSQNNLCSVTLTAVNLINRITITLTLHSHFDYHKFTIIWNVNKTWSNHRNEPFFFSFLFPSFH